MSCNVEHGRCGKRGLSRQDDPARRRSKLVSQRKAGHEFGISTYDIIKAIRFSGSGTT